MALKLLGVSYNVSYPHEELQLMLYDCWNALCSYALARVHVVQPIWALMSSRLEF
jgi:hypothetical protein